VSTLAGYLDANSL